MNVRVHASLMPDRYSQFLRVCVFRMIRARRLQFRAYSTTQNLLGDDLGPIQRNEDQHKSFRVRQDGSSLPLPPSLDPVVVSERSRWEQLKEKPNVANFTPFQKKLWENPYAHILASPPRQCRATNSLQPSALQTSLHPRPHPSTKTPWLLPVSLTTPTHHLGPPFRFLSHKFVAAHLGKKKAWKSGLYFRIYEKIGSKATHEIIWREDMPELILGLLRERLLGKLKWWFSKRGQLVGCISPWHEHIESIDHVSSILSLKSLRTHADDLKDAAASIAASSDKWVSYTAKGLPDLFDPHSKPNVTHRAPSWYQEPLLPRLQPRLQYPPLEFKTTVWRGQKVAVYSLVDLLGEEKTKELVEGSMYEGESCLVVRSGRHNVKIEMLLMELQCYTADHEP